MNECLETAESFVFMTILWRLSFTSLLLLFTYCDHGHGNGRATLGFFGEPHRMGVIFRSRYSASFPEMTDFGLKVSRLFALAYGISSDKKKKVIKDDSSKNSTCQVYVRPSSSTLFDVVCLQQEGLAWRVGVTVSEFCNTPDRVEQLFTVALNSSTWHV